MKIKKEGRPGRGARMTDERSSWVTSTGTMVESVCESVCALEPTRNAKFASHTVFGLEWEFRDGWMIAIRPLRVAECVSSAKKSTPYYAMFAALLCLVGRLLLIAAQYGIARY